MWQQPSMSWCWIIRINESITHLTNEQMHGSMSPDPPQTTDVSVWNVPSVANNTRGCFLKCNYRLNLNIKPHLLSLGDARSTFSHYFIAKEWDVIDRNKTEGCRGGIGVLVQSGLGVWISRIPLLHFSLFVFKSLLNAQINVCTPGGPTLHILFCQQPVTILLLKPKTNF